MSKYRQITALLLGYSVTLAAFAAPAPAAKPEHPKPVAAATTVPPAVKPPKAVVYADQPLPAAGKQGEAEPLPSPLTPGERVVVALDPKEDFIILGKDEPDPVTPEPPAPEAEKSMLPLVDVLGLGHSEPPPMKAPVSVSNGIVPPGPVLTPIVMVAGPNIGAKPALPKTPVKKTEESTGLKNAVTVLLKPAETSLPKLKVILEKPATLAELKVESMPATAEVQPQLQPLVFAKKSTAKLAPTKQKARARPSTPGPVNPNPVRKRTALVKPVIQQKPTHVVHHASIVKTVKPTVKPAVVLKKPEKLAFKPVIKAFVPTRHAAVVQLKPVLKKVKVATAVPQPKPKKVKTAAKQFVFKPVIKPYVKA